MADNETHQEQVRRQLSELLSELRVALPGVTVLFAFLLTLPLTSGFGDLSQSQDAAYFTGLMAAAAATILFIAPSAMHRIEHGDEGDRKDLVDTATRLAIAGTAFLLLAVVASLYLAVDIVYDNLVGTVSAAAIGLMALFFWFILPLYRTLTRRRED